MPIKISGNSSVKKDKPKVKDRVGEIPFIFGNSIIVKNPMSSFGFDIVGPNNIPVGRPKDKREVYEVIMDDIENMSDEYFIAKYADKTVEEILTMTKNRLK